MSLLVEFWSVNPTKQAPMKTWQVFTSTLTTFPSLMNRLMMCVLSRKLLAKGSNGTRP